MSSLEQRLADLERCRVDLTKRLARDDRDAPLYGFKGLVRQFGGIARRTLKRAPRQDIVEWAESNLFLNNITSPGRGGRPLRLSNYQKQMLRLMVAGTTRRFVCRKSSQVGWSLLCAIVVFYVLAHLALPAAYISRSDADVDKWMKQFFHPMLNDPNNKVMARIKRTPKPGEDKDSLRGKVFKNGAVFYPRTAASDDATKGITVWLVVADEIDSDTWLERASSQGSKLDALRARHIQFHDGRIVAGGTPTLAKTSNIEREMRTSDDRRWLVPCPHCSGAVDRETGNAVAAPDAVEMKGWQEIVWGDDDPARPGFKWELRPHDHSVVQTVYQCEHDAQHRTDEIGPDKYDWREWCDRHGEFVPRASGGDWRRGDRPMEWVQESERIDEETGLVVPITTNAQPGVVGCSVWAGVNPMLSRSGIVADWLDSKRKGIGSIKYFTQHVLGRAWEARSAYVEVAISALEKNCVRYPAEIPNDVLFITAWWDAQDNSKTSGKRERIEGTIMGWGREDTAYFIAHHVIEGELYARDMEMQLEKLLERRYRNEAGRYLPVIISGNDNGFATSKVNDYVRKWNSEGRMRVATRGYPDKTGLGAPWASLINLNAGYNDKKAWRWHYIDTLRGKDELAAKLVAGQKMGGIFFPRSAAYLPEYFAGLTAERRVPYKQGWKWEPKGVLTGEPLDAYVGNAAMRDMVKASHPAFANYDKLIERAPWDVPLVPTLISHPWDGDDMSVQSNLIPGTTMHLPDPEGIGARAAAAVQRPTGARPSGVRSALTEQKSDRPPQQADHRPRVVAEHQGWSGGGWNGDVGGSGGGWGT